MYNIHADVKKNNLFLFFLENSVIQCIRRFFLFFLWWALSRMRWWSKLGDGKLYKPLHGHSFITFTKEAMINIPYSRKIEYRINTSYNNWLSQDYPKKNPTTQTTRTTTSIHFLFVAFQPHHHQWRKRKEQ